MTGNAMKASVMNGALMVQPMLAAKSFSSICFLETCSGSLTGGNFDELREHICSRLFILPPETTVYPGHGDSTTIGIEKVENPFFR